MRRLGWLLAALALVGCGVPVEDQVRALDPSSAPRGLFVEDEAPTEQGDAPVELWFTQGEALAPVVRAVELPVTPQRVLQVLFEGPTDRERSAGLARAVPSTISIDSVDLRDGIATVSLDGPVGTLEAEPFAAIVATLTARPEVTSVRFRSDGTDLQVPQGDLSLTDAPVDRDDYVQILDPRPAAGATPAAPTG